jgi:hypothetical protein
MPYRDKELKMNADRQNGARYRARLRSGEKWEGYSYREPSICQDKGYRRISIPSALGYKRRYEHTVIAEKVLGRPLKRGEQVHHINGNKLDNRNCNLLICDVAYHALLHATMSALYQREHFSAV